jgi:hypothetical protein
MTIMDKYLSGVAAFVVLVAVVCSFVLWPPRGDKRDAKTYIDDIRSHSAYASYFLSAITLFFGLSIRVNFSLHRVSVVILLVAFLSAALTIIFVPIRYVESSMTGAPPHANPVDARRLWRWKLMTLNLCVALTFIGLLDALQGLLFQGVPTAS